MKQGKPLPARAKPDVITACLPLPWASFMTISSPPHTGHVILSCDLPHGWDTAKFAATGTVTSSHSTRKEKTQWRTAVIWRCCQSSRRRGANHNMTSTMGSGSYRLPTKCSCSLSQRDKLFLLCEVPPCPHKQGSHWRKQIKVRHWERPLREPRSGGPLARPPACQPAMSCVHYKFSSKLNYDTVTFDGLHISLCDLKRQINNCCPPF
ncbi:E3 ubiquitin-protein ligase RBBP6 [Crotalus adamanteus]|uniref:E3 ubiquitin-protein ligase RBBP6 n=1 Tax=Crotalus adamanteus TaxID=8729 RepID=A0AAW1B3J5_CROAD